MGDPSASAVPAGGAAGAACGARRARALRPETGHFHKAAAACGAHDSPACGADGSAGLFVAEHGEVRTLLDTRAPFESFRSVLSVAGHGQLGLRVRLADGRQLILRVDRPS